MEPTRALAALRSRLVHLPSLVHGRGRTIGAGLLAAIAAVVAVLRRRRRVVLAFPDPGPLAMETAISIHNTAKGAVIAAAREADEPEVALVERVVRAAVLDAASCGADVVAAAVGAVEGASEIAHLTGVDAERLAAAATRVAIEAAAQQGDIASARVDDQLGHLLRLG